MEGHATPKEAAQITGLAVQTLANMRAHGQGPKFVKDAGGKVQYPLESLAQWLAERSSRNDGRLRPRNPKL